MHLSTEEPAASRLLEPFGEVGGDVTEYFSSRIHLIKLKIKKLLRNIRSKNLSARVKKFKVWGLNLHLHPYFVYASLLFSTLG